MATETFGTRLRLARGRAGLTVDALASLSGVSATAITNLENDRVSRPRIQTVVALAKALRIEAGALLEQVAS